MSTDSWRPAPRRSEFIRANCDAAWPGLTSRIRSRQAPPRRGPSERRTPEERPARSADRSLAGEFLDDEGFPRLGQRIPKRKMPSVQNVAREEFVESSERLRDAKGSKKPRRADVIRIDLKKVLERQRSLSESQMASLPKPQVRFNLSLTVRNPLDSTRVVPSQRGKQVEAPRAKKISKLKRVIFRERECKRTPSRRCQLLGFQSDDTAAKEVNDMGFDRLRISPDAGEPEITFVRQLSAMTLFENGHRKPASDHDLEDDPPEDGNPVAERLEKLVIGREKKAVPWRTDLLLDPSITAKTLCLKICDETGENVEDIAKQDTGEDARPIVESTTRHSRKFREYCTNCLTSGLNAATEIFLAEIYRLQRRMYEKNEVKGRSRRRFYAGFKEVLKHVESKKIRFVVIAPDLEEVPEQPDGLDELVKKLVATCKVREIVFCFALSKRKLGYFSHKKGSVSCVGVTNYSGLEEQFEGVLSEVMLARRSYARGNSLEDRIEPREFEESLLSARINLLFRALAISS